MLAFSWNYSNYPVKRNVPTEVRMCFYAKKSNSNVIYNKHHNETEQNPYIDE